MALLHLETRPIETAGVMETRAFTMKANGKAFKVLIDGLYSDKIRAVIRELSSNAYDAQVEAGRADVPFQMHLPTSYEPFFAVRDFGTSMTHEQVMGLYTTVFESSKENSNTQVGKLGLGSKSPFAYNDTFTVTAYLNGEARTYSAFIGADYIPQIALMSRDATTEADGLEVSFPVRSGDYAAFAEAASFTLIGFDVQPTMTGASLPADPRGKLVMKGTNWALYSNIRDAYARQGCVIYPIDVSALPYTEDRRVYQNGIVVDFPIGDLEIAASREGLGYDQQTIDNIMAAADKIADEMMQTALDTLATFSTIWDRMVFLNGLRSGNAPGRVIDAVATAVFGDRYGRHIHFDLFDNNGALEAKQYNRDQLKRSTHPKRVGSPTQIEINGVDNPLVIFNDNAKPSIKNHWGRITQYVRSSSVQFSRAIVVRYDSRVVDTKALFLAAVEGAPTDTFIDLHDLPDPPKAPRAPASERIAARSVERRDIKRCPSVSVDMKAGGYYIPTMRDRVDGKAHVSGVDCYDAIRALVAAGAIPDGTEVYYIPRSTKALGNGKWINVVTLAHTLVVAAADEIATMDEIIRAKDTGYDNRRVGSIALAHLPADHAIVAYYNERQWLQKYTKPAVTAALRTAAREFQFNLDGTSTFIPMDWADVVRNYPLLREVSEINSTNIIDVADYVSLVDNRNANRQAA